MQIFSKRINRAIRQGILLIILIGGVVILTLYGINQSDYVTGDNEYYTQPIPFSHQHHVSGLGIQGQYCHFSVAKASNAGMPSTHTCMTCHSQIWKGQKMFEPLYESYEKGKNIRWKRVYHLADFVYFNHSVHVQKGIQCKRCHGEVSQMPLVKKQQSFTMQWCLECHQNLKEHLPKEIVNKVRHPKMLEDCTTCHR